MIENKPIRRRRASVEKEEQPISAPKDLRMKITIHRGTHQIGGCVTEYESEGWKLFVDYGEELSGSSMNKPLKVEGLTHGDISKSALLITHYHGDHIGCITQLPEELPIYMSEMGREIQLVLSDHLKSVDNIQQRMFDRLQSLKTFKPGAEFSFGPFKIMPIIVDHSAFEACAFKITAQLSVFHTGDFRTHGFRSSKLPKVIEKYVGRVDYVVCEGTNVHRPDATSLSEPELQKQYEARFRKNKCNIVYLSSSNIDRLFGLYHAARKADRPFIVDTYQKRMMDVVTQRDNIWGKSRLYKYDEKYSPMVLQYEDNEFRLNDKFRYLMEQKGYVLIARANDRFDNFIERIPGEKHKYLSMWKGYVEEGCEAYNARLSKSLGKEYEYLHTSGHCDMKSLREFFHMLSPLSIIPIHTDNPEAFANLFCDEFPITVLNDGESISPISGRVSDACSAKIYCVKNLYNLDERYLGNFLNIEDAKTMVTHTKYNPQALLGYEIMEEEDMWPHQIQIYDTEMKPLAQYNHGGHQPGGKHYQEPCRFGKGEKVLALFEAGYNAVVPAIVLGPISHEFIRKCYEQDEEWQDLCPNLEKSLKYWNDWDWDQVFVQPLIKDYAFGKMKDIEFTSRIYLFPYREL